MFTYIIFCLKDARGVIGEESPVGGLQCSTIQDGNSLHIFISVKSGNPWPRPLDTFSRYKRGLCDFYSRK